MPGSYACTSSIKQPGIHLASHTENGRFRTRSGIFPDLLLRPAPAIGLHSRRLVAQWLSDGSLEMQGRRRVASHDQQQLATGPFWKRGSGAPAACSTLATNPVLLSVPSNNPLANPTAKQLPCSQLRNEVSCNHPFPNQPEAPPSHRNGPELAAVCL